MDCRTALETLELAPSDQYAADDSAVWSAAEHVRHCGTCERTLTDRRALDERIGRVLRDVPVPADLKGRLLEAVLQSPSSHGILPQDETVEPTETTPALASNHEVGAERASPSSSRVEVTAAHSDDGGRISPRRRLEVALTTAACLLVGLAVWYLSGLAYPQYTLNALQQRATWDLKELPEFIGDFEARLPVGWPPTTVSFDSVPHGWPADAGTHQVALYEFRVRSRGRTWRGVLLVTPKRRVAPAPSATYFTSAGIEYISNARGRFATTAWSEGDLVYVCAVDGGADVMQTLQRALDRAPA